MEGLEADGEDLQEPSQGLDAGRRRQAPRRPSMPEGPTSRRGALCLFVRPADRHHGRHRPEALVRELWS